MRMRSRLTLACLQQDILWEQPEANRRLVEEAFADVEADLFVVPETFSTGFSDTMAALAEPPEGTTLEWARAFAKKHDALFVGTWTVMEGALVYNRLHYVYPDGTYGYYDKAHTFRMSSEASQLARGRRRVTFEWRGWRIRPAVCYDLRFPIWLRQTTSGQWPVANGQRPAPAHSSPNLGELLSYLPVSTCSAYAEGVCGLDYDLLIVCANWPASRHEAWTTLLRARAIENLAYVAGVNRAGTDGTGIPYSGNSAVVDFKGHDIAVATPGQQDLLLATLDADALDRFRDHWPFYLDADPQAMPGDNKSIPSV